MKTCAEIDDRVRCWSCAHRTRTITVDVSRAGTRLQRRTCRFLLAYDPLQLRRCDRYHPAPPQYIEPLPAGARR